MINETEKDKIYLAFVKCEITKITIKKKGNQVTSRKTEKRNWESEIFYKHEEEKTIMFLSKISKIAKLKEIETIEVKEIIIIKAIGLVT